MREGGRKEGKEEMMKGRRLRVEEREDGRVRERGGKGGETESESLKVS